MFTTVTPGAHEFSIPSSAATPPNEAPYPTDVGTATSGTPTSPPTTLGSAPSIPATTIRQSAASSRSRTAMIRCSPATPDVRDQIDPGPEHPSRRRSLSRHRSIRRTGRHDSDSPAQHGRRRRAPQYGRPGRPLPPAARRRRPPAPRRVSRVASTAWPGWVACRVRSSSTTWTASSRRRRPPRRRRCAPGGRCRAGRSRGRARPVAGTWVRQMSHAANLRGPSRKSPHSVPGTRTLRDHLSTQA